MSGITFFFGKRRLVIIVNLIMYDLLLWDFLHVWSIPTISIDSECMASTFPYMKVISKLVNRLFNSKICCFHIHSVDFYRSIQMTVNMLQLIPNFYTKFQRKNLFLAANPNQNYNVCTVYCIAQHVDKTCFLPACKYQIKVLGNVEELLKKLDTFCFSYQKVDCLYTLFKYRFSEKVIAEWTSVW